MADLHLPFDTTYLSCPCKGSYQGCEVDLIDPALVSALRALSWLVLDEFGKFPSVVLGGGYRCKRYNNKGTGRAKTSQHCLGKAVDWTVALEVSADQAASHLQRLLWLAEQVPAFAHGGIGGYKEKDRSPDPGVIMHVPFVHSDVRGYRARWGIQRRID